MKRFADTKIEQAGAGFRCEGCGISVMADPDRDDWQIKQRKCTGCWVRESNERLNRRSV